MARVIHGDCLEVMRNLKAEGVTVQAIVTDPPYGISFMQRNWDHGIPGVPFWQAAFDLLPPGGHLLAFGGTRTFHRLACCIEDAGFEIRDTLMWVYGSGFPKSHDVSKGIDKAAGAVREVVGRRADADKLSFNGKHAGWDRPWMQDDAALEQCRSITAPATDAAREWAGWGTSLKPAWEPVIMARRPLIGTVSQNVQAHGTGAINVDACRVAGVESTIRTSNAGTNGDGWGMGKVAHINGSTTGRWPANVVHDGSAEVDAAFAAFGEKTSGAFSNRKTAGIWSGDKISQKVSGHTGGDTGTASRFFYSAKASKADRYNSKHPTVKPVALMQWLVRMVTPKGGTVLDPFAGSGTTLQAAALEGFAAIGIEKEAEYVADIKNRMDQMRKDLFMEAGI